jgi:hypothetical protein
MDNNNSQGNPLAVEPQDESLPVALLTAVAVVGLLVFAVGVFWAMKIQESVVAEIEHAQGEHREAEQVGRQEIGIVDQTLFERETRAADMRASTQQRLQSAGWVSQRQQIVHIPITEAMQAVAGGKQVRQPPPPEVQPQGGADAGTPPTEAPAGTTP